MAHIFTIGALHSTRVFQELTAQCAAHNVVELLRNKLVAVELVHIFLALANGTFTI